MTKFKANASETNCFPRYDESGGYHWKECDPRSRMYNPALVTRYRAVATRVAKGSKVLDVGCGDGYLMALIAPEMACVVGVDPEPSGVRIARDKLAAYNNCAVLLGSGVLGVNDFAPFDAALCADVIEHVENDAGLMEEIAAVLGPRGRAIVTTPRREEGRPLGCHHVREYFVQGFRALLEQYFDSVELRFLWPMRWIRFGRTRIGFKAVRAMGRLGWNPFDREGVKAEDYKQMLAVCSGPKESASK